MGEVEVAVINLVYRKSRRVKIMKLISELREAAKFTDFPIVSVNFIEAVDGVRQSFDQLERRYGLVPFSEWPIEDPENRFPSSWRLPQTSGGIASGLSHLDVAARVVGNGRYVLVLEDDCVLTSSPEAAYGHFINCLEEANGLVPDWHMVMLGAAGHRPDIAPPQALENGGLVEVAGFSYLSTMYWLSVAGAKYLCEKRPLCIPNCLAFDELHNALAGLGGSVRPEIYEKFNLHTNRLRLVSAIQSLVRQDSDCTHDTLSTNNRRRSSGGYLASDNDDDDVAPPTSEHTTRSFELELMHAYPVAVGVFWYRRKPHQLVAEDVEKDFLPQKKLIRKKSAAPTVAAASPFSLMATLMRKKRESTVHKESFPISFGMIAPRE